MNVARRWVFPSLRLLVFAAIAVALVKIAFFPDAPPADDSSEPTGSITQPVVAVTRGTVTNEVRVDGVVSSDPAVALKATGTGTVDEIYLGAGSDVAQGDLVYDIRVETPVDPETTTGPDGFPVIVERPPAVTFTRVYAPVAGRITTLDVIVGQAVSTGAATGEVAPPTFTVTGSVTPQQQYRLLGAPNEATVEVDGGPAPFGCASLTVSNSLSGGGAGEGTGAPPSDPSASGTQVRCAVPGDVTVFAGLSATIAIAAGVAEDVLVVPTTAVEGAALDGIVFLPVEGGEPEQRPVTLGLSDGVSVEITGGLEEGEEILQFVPGAPPAGGGGEVGVDGCLTQPDGSVVCGDEVLPAI